MRATLTLRRERARLHLRHMAISFCDTLLHVASQRMTVSEGITLVIAPHQDDEALGCGGLIARKRAEGFPVHIAFITDGSASHPGHPDITPRELSLLRRDEAVRAAACLGVERSHVHFFDEPDGTLKYITPERREALVVQLGALIESVAPAEIFLPCFPDGSSEHDATFGFVIDAIFRTEVRPEMWQYPVWAWWNPGILLRRWAKSAGCRHLPLEDYHQSKQQAIGCYRSQIQPMPPDTHAALPTGLVELFENDTEFFFRYRLPDRLRTP